VCVCGPGQFRLNCVPKATKTEDGAHRSSVWLDISHQVVHNCQCNVLLSTRLCCLLHDWDTSGTLNPTHSLTHTTKTMSTVVQPAAVCCWLRHDWSTASLQTFDIACRGRTYFAAVSVCVYVRHNCSFVTCEWDLSADASDQCRTGTFVSELATVQLSSTRLHITDLYSHVKSLWFFSQISRPCTVLKK